MQKLYVKDRDEKGKEVLRPVRVIRAWQDADGRQLFLHHNGVYGYKDGTPARSEQDFDLIEAKPQKKLALNWWKKIGARMSREYYEQQEQAEETAQAEGVPVVRGDSSELDMVLYRRRPLKGKRVFGEAATWYSWFEDRPDWWGHAGVIEIGAHRYERTALDEAEQAEEAKAHEEEDAVNF